MEPVADYVVVGAGSAGAAVAGRLAADGRRRVLLLEAGPSDIGFWTLVPVGYGHSFRNPRVNWMYMSEPEPGLDGRPIYVPRGKVVGGSSSINAMVYSRGQRGDFEDWEAEGNPGWGWAEVLEAYRRMEDHALGAGPYHGAGGPVTVTCQDGECHPLADRFFAAAAELGMARTADLNGETIEGAGHYQITTRGGMRLSSARAFLWPVRGQGNLSCVTRARATRVILDGRRAVGVAFRRGDGPEEEVRAGRGVILAGGSIGTPQLLQVSGIGPAEVLAGVGVPVLHHLPAVGRHLQDHICYDHIHRATEPTLNDIFSPLAGRLTAGLRYLLTRRGPLSISVNHAGGYIRSHPEADRPDVQVYFSPLSYERVPPTPTRKITRTDPFPGFCLSISPCRPTSRGEIAIRSADPAVPPAIRLGLLATPEDVETARRGALFLRALSRTAALSGLIAEEIRPGPAVADEDLVADLRARAYSVYHPVGSCRMGPDPARAVVDHRLRVHGLDGLRIVDASVFPFVPSGNTNAPAMMVGMRAADFIAADEAGG